MPEFPLSILCVFRYCNKEYDFPTQEEVVHWAAERAEVNAASGKKCLFVCGSYTIGKISIS
jgi:hypothetical protein